MGTFSLEQTRGSASPLVPYVEWILVILSILVPLALLAKRIAVGAQRFYNTSKMASYYFTKYQGHPQGGIFQHFCGLSFILRDKMYFKFYLGAKPFVLLHKPESAEVLLTNPNLIDKAFEYSFLVPWLKDGLITSTGSKWKSRRKLITPSFHFKILEDFLPIFNEQSMILVDKLHRLMGEQDQVDIVPIMALCALDIICETAMGKHVAAQSNSESPYVKSLKETQSVILGRIFCPWLWPDFVFNLTPKSKILKNSLKCMKDFTTEVIAERKEVFRKALSAGNYNPSLASPEQEFITQRRRAFLDLLLYYHVVEGSLTFEEVEEEVEAFMFTGHDSASLGVSWVVYLLGLYPEFQKRVLAEIDDIFEGDLERPVTKDDIKKMKYLECVMKESQRLYPVVPYIARHLTADLKMGKYTIPRGASVLVLIYMIHHNSDVYPNPEVFDPDRFLPENTMKRHPFAYIPFSAGPRNCVGQKFAQMEQKVILANIFRRFHVQSLIPRDRLELVPELVLQPRPGLFMKFIPRLEEIEVNNNRTDLS